jgi:hypothetical protein
MNGNESVQGISAEVADFLQQKGTLEMVVRIGERGSQRHTDLRNELLTLLCSVAEPSHGGYGIPPTAVVHDQ